jgi:hypothetical protein
MRESGAERYIRLGLQLGRHVEGIVDAYFGPPDLAEEVDAGALADPQVLVASADDLLGELADGWLRDQVIGLRTYAGVLAEKPISYADEVEGCYGVRPKHTDEAVFRAAHTELEELLPGDRPLAERHERWERSINVPAEQVESTVAAVIEQARTWTRGLADLPVGEDVELELVHGEPWLAFCQYLGNFHSRISINVDLPISALELLRLTLHETYPGHHAERCLKEAGLVRDRGLFEETLVLVPTPQSLVSEGMAKLAPSLVLEGTGGTAFEAIVNDAGCTFDLAHALEIDRAGEVLSWALVNAALLLHDDGACEAEARTYLERWALATPELAAHLVRFLSEPTSRTYAITYAAGRELCGSFVASDPRRFLRLLTEQVRVRDLLEPRPA